MKTHYVSFEIAKRLKKLGFDEPCQAVYYCADDTNEIKFEPNIEEDGNEMHNYTYLVKGVTNSVFGRRDSFAVFDTYTAPTFHQVFDWFEEKLHIIIFPSYDTLNYFPWGTTVIDIETNKEVVTCRAMGRKDASDMGIRIAIQHAIENKSELLKTITSNE